MDGTSPGNMPVSLGEVWVGETRWAPQHCFIDWPQHGPAPTFVPTAPAPYLSPQSHFHFTPTRQLSDADVERIARRVAELIKEPR